MIGGCPLSNARQVGAFRRDRSLAVDLQRSIGLVLLLVGLASAVGPGGLARAAKASDSTGELKPFEGTPTKWHEGFNRYDFVMDEQTLEIKPYAAPAAEKFGIGAPAKGQRRCVVIVPKTEASGSPWSWRGCYWDHQPQTEVELLRRGFHIAYISADAGLKPGPQWDAWYAFLTEGHGLSRKPAFIGMSRGGEYAYTWATNHPDEVSCIYADNPGGNSQMLAKLGGLAENDVPLLHVCGSIDPLLGKYSNSIENIYQQFGGRISVMIKEGYGHHPHSLRNPKPIADFIVQSVASHAVEPPPYVGRKFTRNSFYGTENTYIDSPDQGTHITCRGPLFTGCYNRYAFDLPGIEGTITVVEPNMPAKGKPWIFRAGYVDHAATVDLALLAKGFYIVTGPVPYNADGPSLAAWDAVYKHLVENGFSSRPAMEGAGAAAGEIYDWALANADKVSGIYAENPILHGHMTKASPLEDPAPLLHAGIPILHVCGGLDPAFADNTQALKKKYDAAGGKMSVIVNEGAGHYPTSPANPRPVVDFIVAAQR